MEHATILIPLLSQARPLHHCYFRRFESAWEPHSQPLSQTPSWPSSSSLFASYSWDMYCCAQATFSSNLDTLSGRNLPMPATQ